MFHLEDFISEYVTQRTESMFLGDIENHKDELTIRLQGKSVLVIGGAGSIGSSFIKAILEFHPGELYVVDTNENALTELTRDLRSGGYSVPDTYVSYPMDYSSAVFFKMFVNHKRSVGTGGFDIVANFSAHKHVRSEKDIYSIEALLRNNVINAKGLLDLLADYPPDVYFCVSTDKAANPVNIMGASKRIMEDLIFSYSGLFPVKTARFANVAFSNGSLPQGFLERIERSQPIVAPIDVKRFFVSPSESGQICMLAAMLGNNREIFFPKLTDASMMSFDRIAAALLHELGFEIRNCDTDEEAVRRTAELKRGSRQYPVRFSVSDTSGEKPFEEFYTASEEVDDKRYQSLGVVIGKSVPDKEALADLIDSLENAFEDPLLTKEVIVKIISDYLPDFKHKETGKNLDSKM